MKRIRFPFGGKRASRYVTCADVVIAVGIFLCCGVFKGPLGLTRFAQRVFGVSSGWAKTIIAGGGIALLFIAQIMTYHIDQWLQKRK